MAPDEFQQAWQSQAAKTRITVDPDVLRERVLRRQREFRSTIFWRDVREIGVALSLIPVWFVLGAVTSSPWTWYLTVPVLVWIAGFMLVYRMRHPQYSGDADRSLRESVKGSLSEVEDQIWLLRNVFWWYLLPPGVSLMAFFAHVSWLSSGHWAGALVATLLLSGFVFGVYSLVYQLNQQAVRLELQPQRQELLALLNSLSDEPTSEVTGAYPILMNDRPDRCSKPRLFVGDRRTALVLLIGVPLILLIGVPAILFLAVRVDRATPPGPAPSHPERSPFTAVRWQQFQPEVEVDGEWFTLVSLDGIPVAEIVAFSRRTYRGKWQKRFEEDLVQVLTRMGHPPGDTVTLVVRSLSSQQTQVLEEVPMTRENRQKIREAAFNAEAGTSDAGERAARSRDRNDYTSDRFWERFTIAASGLFTLAVFVLVLAALGAFRRSHAGEPTWDGPAGSALASQVAALRNEKNLVGLAAMVSVDGQLVARAVDGERKKGSGKAIELADQWHIGSITKSITATMIARLVESGRMQWSDTVGECFADASVHEEWKPVKLRQLLTHTAGAPANFPYHVRAKQPALGDECTRERRDAVLEVLAERPAHPPGEKHVYSNVGYTIAGAMAEAATGMNWEELVKREVFEPLQLTSAGFGPPESPDETLDQPRGHAPLIFGWKIPMDDTADNTPIMGPAGTVHMALADLCTYAFEHLQGDSGKGRLLSAETYRRLHTPDLDEYACGWVVKEPTDTIPHRLYWHNGSNTMWYALVVFIPDKNMTVAVASNDGNIAKAESAAWEIVEAATRHVDADGAADGSTTSAAPSLNSQEFK